MSAARRPKDPRPGPDLAQEINRRGEGTPLAWTAVASELERAAELLWDRVETDLRDIDALAVGDTHPHFIIRPTMLLAALALENLFKGVLVTIEPPRDSKGKFRLNSHKLLDLADRAKVVLDADEIDLLERLEMFLVWAGRYPTPIDYTDIMPRTLSSGGFGTLIHSKSGDRDTWRQVLQKLRARFTVKTQTARDV